MSFLYIVTHDNMRECLPRAAITKPTGTSLGKEWANRLIGVSCSGNVHWRRQFSSLKRKMKWSWDMRYSKHVCWWDGSFGMWCRVNGCVSAVYRSAFAFEAKQFRMSTCTFKIRGLQSFKISELLLQWHGVKQTATCRLLRYRAP